jgi:spore maturation protein CgeB
VKILYFGTLSPEGNGRHYARAFEKLGHAVQYFDPGYYLSTNVAQRITQKLTKAPRKARIRMVDAELLAMCNKENFDLVFVMSENFLSKDTIEAIRVETSSHPPLFVFHSLDNLFSNGIKKPKDFFETFTAYDFVFTTKSFNVARYKELGQSQAHYVQSSFEPSVHHPVPEETSLYGDKFFPVTFIGTFDHSREDYVKAIGWDRLHIWGNDWKRFKGYLKNHKAITPRAIYGEEFCDIVSHSQVNLGLLRGEAGDLHTTRTLEIPACGGLQLAPRNDEILSLFEEDKEIVCFGSLEEMESKIDFLLGHKATCSQIARAGYERCLKSGYRYEDQAKEILEKVRLETGRFDQSRRASATRAR